MVLCQFRDLANATGQCRHVQCRDRNASKVLIKKTFFCKEYCSYENQCHGNGSIQFQTSANNFGSRNRYFAEDEFDLTPCFASGAIGDSPIYDVIFSMTDLGHTLLRNHDFADHQFKARQFLTILHGILAVLSNFTLQ